MRIFSNIHRRWLAYLERMANANQKQYGNQRLDCCGLNKDHAHGHGVQGHRG